MNIRLYIDKIYWAFVKKTNKGNKKKSYASWKEKGYNGTPLVSFIIQSHNKSSQVQHIVKKLRKYQNAEIVVIDDGSEQTHTKTLSSFLSNANEFLIHSNDLYEVIMYDKVLRFVNGKYICLLQDDDDFENLNWVEKAVEYFQQIPQLAILGGNNGQSVEIKNNNIHFVEPLKEEKSQEFTFVMYVDRAPMWINRSLYMEHLKNINQSFAPFQFDDCDLCLRAWMSGLLVGWYPTHFKSLCAGGMRIWNNSFTQEQCNRNSKQLIEYHKNQINHIKSAVENARKNIKTVK